MSSKMRVLQTVLTVVFLQSIAATEVTFSHADWSQVSCGERLILNCTGSFNHNTEILEIGKNDTIDMMIEKIMPVPGNPTRKYVPEGCNSNSTMTNKTCSKIINITVTAAMHGKSYQCVSYRRGILLPKKYYSLGGYIAVEDIEACTDEISAVPPSPTKTITSIFYPSSTTTSVLSFPTIGSTPLLSPSTSPPGIMLCTSGSALSLHRLQQIMIHMLSSTFTIYFILYW